MSKGKNGLQELAENIRSKADMIRKKKAEASLTLISSAVDVGLVIGHTMKKYGETVTAFSTGVVAICEEITDNAQTKKQVLTLGANLADNAASRLHEIANILESVSKSPGLQNAIINAKKSAEEMVEAAKHFKKRGSKSMRKKFKVVREDSEKT